MKRTWRGAARCVSTLAWLFLAGCGNGHSDYGPGTPIPAQVAAKPPLGVEPTPITTSDKPDPLEADAHLHDGDPSATTTPGSADGAKADDPLTGPHMPTQHSHWLHGSIFNATVTVSLNGLKLGEFRAPVDKDITMRMHKGLNTVTFTYQPLVSTASANLNILESEHDPPIAPLASFRTSLPASGDTESPITQTFTFIAQ